MRKFVSILLVIMIPILCASCGNSKEEKSKKKDFVSKESESVTENDAGVAGVANPITYCNSLEEVNEATGGKLSSPGVMGVTDEMYSVVDCVDYKIGQYDFTINGAVCSMRFSTNTTDDITGIYSDGEPIFPEDNNENLLAKTEEYYIARWFTKEGQYVLIVDNSNVDDILFSQIKEEIQVLTASEVTEEDLIAFYDGLKGDYQDATTQATLTVESLGADGVKITVDWSTTYNETDEWTMIATKSEDGYLRYSDCENSHVTFNDDGEETDRAINYSDGVGFFVVYSGNILAWEGAADTDCAECSFEKIITED